MISLQSPAGDVRGLSRAQHLVLFGFRATALGHGDCPVVHRVFRSLLGDHADGALGGLLVFVRVIGAAGARKVRLQPPGCCAVADDERLILSALAAAQASLAGADEDDLRTCLAALLDQPPHEAAMMAAQGLATTLTLGGLHLPQEIAGAPAGRTLH